jgi:TolB protein
VLLAVAALEPARAVFPGANGKIAFECDREICTVKPDGRDRMWLTNNSAFDSSPTFAPGGRRIAFESNKEGNSEVYTMTSDGTGVQTNVSHNPTAFDGDPSYSPDGRRIVFVTGRDGNAEIYVMLSAGIGPQINLTRNPAPDLYPAYSPDGTKIAFTTRRLSEDGNTEVYSMNPDGTGQENLSNSGGEDLLPSFSPDGRRIVFVSGRNGNREIYVMNSDGTGRQKRLTRDPAFDSNPTFSPDGTKIAFTRPASELGDTATVIMVMNDDGTNLKQLTSVDYGDSLRPDWQHVP